jgi:hypothetical protein
VKNCGAWGSIAPPITVDIMVVLPVLAKISPKGRDNKPTQRPQRIVRLHR